MFRVALRYIGLILLFTACIPQEVVPSRNIPQIAIVNGPRSIAITGLAARVQDEMRLVGHKNLGFSRKRVVRIRERAHAFGPGRLISDAVRIGRNIGADLIVLVGAPKVDRTSRERFSLGLPNPLQNIREIKTSLRVQFIVIEISSNKIVKEYIGPVIEVERTERATVPITPIYEDPDYAEAVQLGAREVSRKFTEWFDKNYLPLNISGSRPE